MFTSLGGVLDGQDDDFFGVEIDSIMIRYGYRRTTSLRTLGVVCCRPA